MKKTILTLMIFAYTLVGFNVNAATHVDNSLDKPEIKNISEVIVNIPSNVYFYQGDEFGINIRTNKNLFKQIKYEIKNDKLYIDFNKIKYNMEDSINPEDIKIYIQSPNEIKKVKTNSSLLVAKLQKHHATNNGNN